MIDWEIFGPLVDEQYLTDEQRFERRQMRELMWSISPLTFSAILFAIAAQAGWRALLSGARRSWVRPDILFNVRRFSRSRTRGFSVSR